MWHFDPNNFCIHNWLILFEKEIYFCASFLPLFLFLIKVEFLCFSSTPGLIPIPSGFWSMYSLSGWCSCILNPSMSVLGHWPGFTGWL